jgi:protein SCO1/2
MRPHARIILAALIALLVASLVLVLMILDQPATRSPSATSEAISSEDIPSASGFDGAALPPGIRAHGFTLTALSAPIGQPVGKQVSLSSFRGQVVVLAFLYSTCGPTCIVIAQQIRGALNELGGAVGGHSVERHSVAVLIVSADPSADTPASVSRFLAQVSLAGRVHYLTGSPAQLRTVWRAYRVTPARAGGAAFDNAASVLLIDPSGFERVVFGVEQITPEALTHDIGKLQAG